MSERIESAAALSVEPAPVTPGSPAATRADNVRRWSRWARLLIERTPIPYWVMVSLATLVVGAEQLFEFVMDVGAVQSSTSSMLAKMVPYLVLPVLTLYMLLMMRTLKSSTVRALAELRPAVRISDKEYDNHVYQMVNTSPRVEFALLGIAVVGVYLLYGLANNSPSVTNTVRASGFGAGVILTLGPLVIFGWVFLAFVFSALQLGRALGKLAYRPLAVNIYDVGNLLPFGHISLIYSLAVAGGILILLVGLGQPTQPSSWGVIIALSVASVVALVFPLRGVNQQLREARHVELERIHAQLRSIHDIILERMDLEPDALSRAATRIGALVDLRKVVLETPTWPYRDTLMIVRAIVVAIAPLMYFVLTQIITGFFFAK